MVSNSTTPHSKPSRRLRLQFSVGTMLLAVTVFALWLAWELGYIHQRQAFLAWVDRKNAEAQKAPPTAWCEARTL